MKGKYGRVVHRTCRVLGIRIQTYYRRKQGFRTEVRHDELAEKLREKAEAHPYWGFWMIYRVLRREGCTRNHKVVYKLWKSMGYNLRQVKNRPKIKREYKALTPPPAPNVGWAMDFLGDWVNHVDTPLSAVRMINVIDEHSRKALWTEAFERIPARTLIDCLNKTVAYRGKPAYIRCDNGPEFISDKLKAWAEKQGIELKFIQPGKPTQNAYVERLNGTVRRECLNLEWFGNLAELNAALQKWQVCYNMQRPHSSLKHRTPDEAELNYEKFHSKTVA